MDTTLITEEYFNKLSFVSQTISSFADELMEKSEIMDMVSSSDYVQRIVEDENWNFNPIATAIMIDVSNCYQLLGHKIDPNSAEGLGLVLLDHYLFDLQYGSVEYHDLPTDDYLVDHTKKNLSRLEGLGTRQEWSLKGDLLLGMILSLADKMLAERYVLRLFRFFEAVASVDNILSYEEKEWLKAFAPFKDKYVIS